MGVENFSGRDGYRVGPGHAGVGVDFPRWKRVVDLVLVLLGAPVVLVVGGMIGCWIRAVSPGEVLFRQERIGRGGVAFTMYKFRSMRAGAATGCHEAHVKELVLGDRPLRKLDALGDPRVIPGGRLLRTLGFDELPQLINVLRGEMSLVGPRPCLPCEAGYCALSSSRRFELLPGMTGLWQVERDGRTTFREMLEMDDRYVRELSLGLDLRILVRTPVALLGQVLPGRGQAEAVNNRS